ncbi:hypothetical protein A3J44_01930 [candidate division WOR-1 bacterium RIFCSPHIGHO2_02_FULL_45_12]|nr:MAG: hypothetical protein A3J44_01930 [candidate division WOR-1 bacterium RIFCSPHIGHO2_02_FULL_45_12]
MVFGMNFGTGRMEDGWETNSSFASLQHEHVQMLTQLKDTYNPGDEIADFIESWPYETPFLEAYLQALENNQLVIKKYGAGDNICAWLIVPRSQKAMHHIRIITNPKAGNFRETDEAIDMALGEAIFDGTMALRSLGVKTFNIISFCKRFSDERQGVPMVVDILPRGGIAFAELSGKGLWVVDGSSEETVRKIRGSTTSNNQSDRCLSRARLVQITLSELQSSANPLGDDPLATHILGGNNNIAVRHFVAATLPAREKLSIYGRDMQLLRELPEGIIIQLGVSRENIIRPRQDSFEEIRQVINLASADKRHCQLLLEVLRIFAQRCHEDKSFLARLHDKFNTEMSARREKRIILDDLINIPNIPWQNLCNLSAEDLTEAIYQRMDEICHK